MKGPSWASALGVDTFAVASPTERPSTAIGCPRRFRHHLCDRGRARDIIDIIAEYSHRPLPVVLTIPDSSGKRARPWSSIRRTVERASAPTSCSGKKGMPDMNPGRSRNDRQSFGAAGRAEGMAGAKMYDGRVSTSSIGEIIEMRGDSRIHRLTRKRRVGPYSRSSPQASRSRLSSARDSSDPSMTESSAHWTGSGLAMATGSQGA